jgi:hypothetical protein
MKQIFYLLIKKLFLNLIKKLKIKLLSKALIKLYFGKVKKKKCSLKKEIKNKGFYNKS